MAEPTYNAARYIEGRREGKANDLRLAETGSKPTGTPSLNLGVGSRRVTYLRRIRRDLAVYCTIMLEARSKGREVEHVSPETERHRAKAIARRHPRKTEEP